MAKKISLIEFIKICGPEYVPEPWQRLILEKLSSFRVSHERLIIVTNPSRSSAYDDWLRVTKKWG